MCRVSLLQSVYDYFLVGGGGGLHSISWKYSRKLSLNIVGISPERFEVFQSIFEILIKASNKTF